MTEADLGGNALRTLIPVSAIYGVVCVLVFRRLVEGPALLGSPQHIIEKILSFHKAFSHDLQSSSLPTMLPARGAAGDARVPGRPK